MPGPDGQDVRRDGRLSTGLFWGGVGLAPVAALALLLGPEGAALRFAAVLALVAVVLIGFSMTLRGNAEAVRAEIEEALYEEIDALRNDVRQDIGTAARATHRAFGEKLQVIYQQMNGVRAQLEAGHPDAGQASYDRPAVGPGPVHTPAGGVVGAAGVGRVAPSGGVVRHTETVQVTTRQTIVDPPREDVARGGTVYGGAGHGRRDEPDDGGWPEQRPRGEARRGRPYDRDGEPDIDERWSDVRAGDRWGAVREDERGREVRMGERRAAVHADSSGTEMRFEDRWAAVRRDESRREGPRDEQWRGGPYDERRDDGYGRDDRWRDDRNGWREEPAGDGGRYVDGSTGWGDDRAGRGGEQAGWREDASAAWGGDAGAGRAGGEDRWAGGDGTGWDGGGRWAGGDEGGAQGGWEDRRAAAGWDDGRRAEGGWDDGRRAQTGVGDGRRAVPALPAGGQQRGIWEGDWVEAERQPVGGRRRRDEEPDYRHSSERDDRWR